MTVQAVPREESEEKVQYPVRMSRTMRQRAMERAESQGRSLNAHINFLLEKDLAAKTEPDSQG